MLLKTMPKNIFRMLQNYHHNVYYLFIPLTPQSGTQAQSCDDTEAEAVALVKRLRPDSMGE
jgi:hypothetical protein